MLTYTDIGTGIPIVLIHGLGSRKEAWIPQYPLARKYRLIIPDLRGHGETVINKDITVENFAKDVIELLDSLNIDSTYICGLSLGGIVAQEVYKQAPKKVKGLILSNTTSYIHPLFASYFLHDAKKNHMKDDYIDHIIDRGIYNERNVEKARGAFLIRDSYIESATAPVGLNYFPTLLSIDVPVLLIGSTCDKVTPILNMYLMGLFIHGARKAVFPRTGHLSNIERPILFNHYISDFIEGH